MVGVAVVEARLTVAPPIDVRSTRSAGMTFTLALLRRGMEKGRDLVNLRDFAATTRRSEQN
jgi:hypothetical protein